MCEYLPGEHFGQSAARVLAEQWLAANELSDEKRFRSNVDFARVETKRAARAANPTVTSAEAEAIFGVIEPFIADEATDDKKKHAIALGVIAARLPHGERDPSIQKLLSLAPCRARAALLQNLILSGESIDIEMVRNGITEVLEAARTQIWTLSQDGYKLKEWLRLLPFTNRAGDALDIVRGLPDQQRDPTFLEEMISAFGEAPSKDAENVLFQLAERDPRFYANHAWHDAIMRRAKGSSARRVVDLAAKGAFDGKGIDQWHMASRIGGLIGEAPELRAYVYNLLTPGTPSPGLALLALAIAENPDEEGLLLLIKRELEHKHSIISRHTIESVVSKHVPAENWRGAFNTFRPQN
jgi:hypothetical protein